MEIGATNPLSIEKRLVFKILIMNQLPKLRFDCLAGYTRKPIFVLIVEELEWFEEAGEKLLGLVAFDLSDHDYACYVLGRDKKNRFRAVWLDHSISTAWPRDSLSSGR